SAGGQLALWLAARHKLPGSAAARELASRATEGPIALRGAVSLAGVVDLVRADALGLGGGAAAALLGGTRAEVPDRYAASSPRALLPIGVRQILVHGEDDGIVPVELSVDYAQAARGAGDPASLVTLPGVDHFEPIDPESGAWPAVKGATLAMAGRG